MLRARYGAAVGTTRSGAYSAPFFDTDALLTEAVEAIRGAGKQPGAEVALALAAGGRLRHDAGWYRIDRERLTPREVIEHVARACEKFPVVAVEDALAEDDWEHWKALHERLAGRARVHAHELTGADLPRIARAASESAADVIRLDPADLATVTDAAQACQAARKAGLELVVGAADAETEDDWLIDLAVGLGASELHLGGLHGAERTAKYNRLLAIAQKNRWPLHPRAAL
jgi:enolase